MLFVEKAGGVSFRPFCVYFGLLIDYQLYFHRKQLPYGRRVYAYSAADRVHGLRILVLPAASLLG